MLNIEPSWGPDIGPGVNILTYRIFAIYSNCGVTIAISNAVVLEKNIFLRHTSYFHCFVIILLLKRARPFFNNLEVPSHKNALYQIWLNLVLCF